MNEVRIDKWMWAMRIFKTRTIATDACKKGRVLMGGVAVKPSRTIKEGDIINGLGRPTKREGRDLAEFTDSLSEGWDIDFLDDDDE